MRRCSIGAMRCSSPTHPGFLLEAMLERVQSRRLPSARHGRGARALSDAESRLGRGRAARRIRARHGRGRDPPRLPETGSPCGPAAPYRCRGSGFERVGGGWQVHTGVGTFVAPVLVNATGAWADRVAIRPACTRSACSRCAGRPCYRGPPGTNGAVANGDRRRGRVLLQARRGPAVALARERGPGGTLRRDAGRNRRRDRRGSIRARDRVRVDKVGHSWAGLRSFVADRAPVVGFDDGVDGFFWLAGQGGYGIQMAPALARAAAALLSGQRLPADIADQGVTEHALSPARLDERMHPRGNTDDRPSRIPAYARRAFRRPARLPVGTELPGTCPASPDCACTTSTKVRAMPCRPTCACTASPPGATSTGG